MTREPWTNEEWAAWRDNNCRLMAEGWSLHTNQMVNGDVECYAERDGIKVNREPRWIEE